MSPAAKVGPDLKAMLRSVAQDQLLIPVVRAALYDPSFKGFDIPVRGWTAREPDFWFHPSTHPLWTERQLFYWMTEPEKLVQERMELSGVLAVTSGTFWHEFVQRLLYDNGILTRAEVPLEDPEAKSRGHMDGLLATWEGFEFKCLVPETKVYLADGGWKRADEVEVGDSVLAWDGEGLAPGKISYAGDNGVQPIYSVRTKQGRTVRTTAEHPFLTERGWVAASHLQPGDRVRVATDRTPDPVEVLPDDLAWFLGAMVGDGGCTTPSITFSNVDPAVLAGVNEVLSEFGCSLVNTGRPADWRISQASDAKSVNRAKAFLKGAGLTGGCREKQIPQVVWQGGEKAWASFLSGYLDADGTVPSHPYPQVIWTSVNQSLLQECQTMLALLGIRASLMKVTFRDHKSWRLLVRDGAAVAKAQSLLTPKGAKSWALSALQPKIPKVGHHRTARPEWDEVWRVFEDEPRQTIALEVEGHHTHVTDGLVTHNTMNPTKQSKIKDAETLLEFAPDYYAQAQEYLRLSNLQRMRFLILSVVYPFTMSEFTVDYDPGVAGAIRNKYLNVLDAVKKASIPQPCCPLKSKTARSCAARLICPIGQAS